MPTRKLAVALPALTLFLATADVAGAATKGAPAALPAPGVVKVAAMATPRAAHQATLLPSGEVLMTGGCTGTCDTMLASNERYDPQRRQFRPAAQLHTARSSHVAIALADGRVLIAGGWSGNTVTASAELYDPVRDRVDPLPPMRTARAGATASLLPDGRVLLAGGQDSSLEPVAGAEIFDPAGGGFIAAATPGVARMNHVAVTLTDGRVLLIGGRGSRRGPTLASAEWFTPATGKWQPAGTMQQARHKHAAAALADGRVLVVGGSDARDDQGRYADSELFDPRSGRFEPGPVMHWSRFKIMHALVTLADGSAVIAGGARVPERFVGSPPSFTPVAGAPDQALDYAPELATATRLNTGEALLVGGYDAAIRCQAQAWLIRP